MECNCLQELNSAGHAPYIMSALLNSTQSMIHGVYNYYLWTLSLAGTVPYSQSLVFFYLLIFLVTRQTSFFSSDSWIIYLMLSIPRIRGSVNCKQLHGGQLIFTALIKIRCTNISVHCRQYLQVHIPAGTAAGYGLNGRGIQVRFPAGEEIFLFSTASRPILEHNLLSNGYRGFFPRGKAAGAWIWPLISI
jgi:hypothetical protein